MCTREFHAKDNSHIENRILCNAYLHIQNKIFVDTMNKCMCQVNQVRLLSYIGSKIEEDVTELLLVEVEMDMSMNDFLYQVNIRNSIVIILNHP